jgi:hypothetical protein
MMTSSRVTGTEKRFLFGVNGLVDAHVARFARDLLYPDLLAQQGDADLLLSVAGLRRAPSRRRGRCRGRAGRRRRRDRGLTRVRRRCGRLEVTAAQEVRQRVTDGAAADVGDVVVAKLVVLRKEHALLDHEGIAVTANDFADAFSLCAHDEHAIAYAGLVHLIRHPPPIGERLQHRDPRNAAARGGVDDAGPCQRGKRGELMAQATPMTPDLMGIVSKQITPDIIRNVASQLK